MGTITFMALVRVNLFGTISSHSTASRRGIASCEDWFQVFVQKVVRRVGMEVMSFFAALLESQLY